METKKTKEGKMKGKSLVLCLFISVFLTINVWANERPSLVQYPVKVKTETPKPAPAPALPTVITNWLDRDKTYLLWKLLELMAQN